MSGWWGGRKKNRAHEKGLLPAAASPDRAQDGGSAGSGGRGARLGVDVLPASRHLSGGDGSVEPSLSGRTHPPAQDDPADGSVSQPPSPLDLHLTRTLVLAELRLLVLDDQ